MDEMILQKEALRLPPGERALLADALLGSLDSEETRAIESAWVAEAEDRLDAYSNGKLESADGPGLLESLKARYPK